MSGWFTLGAAAIAGGSSLLGGFLGGKKDKKAQREAQAFEAQRIRMMSNDAKLAGIHPLAALGVAQSYQNPAMMIRSDGMANGVSQAGAAAANALNDYGNTKRAAQERELQNKLMIAKQASEARVAESEVARNNAEAYESWRRGMAIGATDHQVRWNAAAELRNPPGGYSNTGDPTQFRAGTAGPTDVKMYDPYSGKEVMRTSMDTPDIDQVAMNWISKGVEWLQANAVDHTPPADELRRSHMNAQTKRAIRVIERRVRYLMKRRGITRREALQLIKERSN